MFKSTTLWTIFFGVILIANSVMAGDATMLRSDLPVTYQLEDVRISVLYQTGHRIPGSYVIDIQGDGTASYVIDKHEKTALILQNETLVELLNDFYRIHFFELADTYTVKRQVILQDNKKIATVIRKMVDMSSQRLCIGIAEYEKCVTIMDGQPQEASQLVKKIEALFSKGDSEQ